MRIYLAALAGGITAGVAFVAFDHLRTRRNQRQFLKRLTQAMTEGIDKPGEAAARTPYVYGKTVMLDGLRFDSDPEYFVSRIER